MFWQPEVIIGFKRSNQNFVLHDKLETADSLIAKVFLRTLDFDF